MESRRLLSGTIIPNPIGSDPGTSHNPGPINLFTLSATDVEPGTTVFAAFNVSVKTGWIAIYLSADKSISSDDTLVGGQMGYGDLPPFGFPITNVTIPADFAPGQYFPIATLNGYNYVADPITVHAPAPVDGFVPSFTGAYAQLAATPDHSPDGSIPAGGRTLFVASIGNFDQLYHVPVTFYLSPDGVAGNADDIFIASAVATRYATMPLGSAGAQLNLPPTVTAGTYRVVAVADNAAPYLGSELRVASVTTDIAPTSVSAPEAATPGSSLNLDLSFVIDSPAPTTYQGSFNAAYYLSADDIPGNDDDILLPDPLYGQTIHSTSYPNVFLHSGFTQPDTVTVPTSVAPGTYQLFVIVDRDNQVAEASELNNTLLGGQITIVTPDLLPKLALPGHAARPVAPGTTGQATLKLRNLSKSPLARKYAVRLYLSDDAMLSTDDRRFSTQSIRLDIPAGGSVALPVHYRLPRNASLGTRYLILAADLSGPASAASRPLSSAAVKAAARIEVATRIKVAAPKLTAVILASHQKGDSTRLTLSLTNIGNAPHHDTAALKIFSQTTDDLIATLTKRLSLKPGQSRTLTLTVPTTDPVRLVVA